MFLYAYVLLGLLTEPLQVVPDVIVFSLMPFRLYLYLRWLIAFKRPSDLLFFFNAKGIDEDGVGRLAEDGRGPGIADEEVAFRINLDFEVGLSTFTTTGVGAMVTVCEHAKLQKQGCLTPPKLA